MDESIILESITGEIPYGFYVNRLSKRLPKVREIDDDNTIPCNMKWSDDSNKSSWTAIIKHEKEMNPNRIDKSWGFLDAIMNYDSGSQVTILLEILIPMNPEIHSRIHHIS